MNKPETFTTIKQPYGSRMCAAAVVAMAIGKDLTWVLNNGVMTPSGISVCMRVSHMLSMLGEHGILCGMPLINLPQMDGSEDLELPINLTGWPSIVTVPCEIEDSTHCVFWDGEVVRDPNPKVPETTHLDQYEILELWPLCYIDTLEEPFPDLDMSEQVTFNPDWVSAPGDTIKDILAEEQMTVTDLAGQLHISYVRTFQLCEGREPLTQEIAEALTRTFSGSVGFWLEREQQYRDGLAQGKKRTGQ